MNNSDDVSILRGKLAAVNAKMKSFKLDDSEALKEFSALDDERLALERGIAKASGAPYAVPLELGCVPEAAVSGEFVIQNFDHTILIFNAMQPDRSKDLGIAVLEFPGMVSSTFGLPNDEAIRGHPLYGSGIDAYECFEIFNSAWLAEMNRRNQIAFPNCSFRDTRHYAFFFHDNSFECLARGYTLKIVPPQEIESFYVDLFKKYR